MKQEEYLKAVVRNLNCSGEKKKDIEKELVADIETAIAAGETWEEVEERMGQPEQLAQEFNENLPGGKQPKGKGKKALLIIGIILGVLVLFSLVGYWILPKNYPLEGSGIFQVATVKEQTELVIELLNKDDYDGLAAMANEQMKDILQRDTMAEAKATLGGDLGAYQGTADAYMIEVSQMGNRYATVQVSAQYENRNVIYTISFDEDMKLAGLYMR